MIDKGALLRHYKQNAIQEAIIACAKDKEIAVRYGDGGFGKRPDTLVYPKDVIEFVQQGATSFHCSEELWENPLQLHTQMKKQDVEKLRKGWDLVLDIDSPFLEYAQITADLLVQALHYHGIESVSIKFSGNHGFHIGVPFESFPEKVDGIPTKCIFPDGPRKIAGYLRYMINTHVAERILEKDNLQTIQEKTGKKFEEIVVKGKFNPFSIVDIDTILLSNRHLYRMPYSFNEKSGLLSIPLNPKKILQFKKEEAKPEKNSVGKEVFLDREKIIPGEAAKLIMQAKDFKIQIIPIAESKLKPEKTYEDVQIAINEEFFPPAIKKMLEGLEDGKKRTLFVLTNFLTSVGWSHDQVLARLRQWNQKNIPPLSETLLVGQVRYHKQQKKRILPPNFDNDNYYNALLPGEVHDNLSRKFKNPVNYTIWRARNARQNKKEEKKKNTPEKPTKKEN